MMHCGGGARAHKSRPSGKPLWFVVGEVRFPFIAYLFATLCRENHKKRGNRASAHQKLVKLT
jgi:hypothetical protein